MAGAYNQMFRMLVTADSSGAVRDLKSFEGQVQKSSTGMAKKLGMTDSAFAGLKMAAAGVGAATALHIGKYSVNAARDLNEAVNAVTVMYGENSDAVLAMSDDAATGMGLSKRAFDESAVAVGGFVKQISEISGTNTDKVLGDLMTRASDFASVFNINVDEALQRFRSGLAGETEPLRRFGINLLQSEVAAYAVSAGIAEAGQTMTEEQKVMARYGLLMLKTSQMQGDFANTSMDMANQQRILRAEVENLASSIGQQAIPAIEDFLASTITLIATGNDLKDWFMEGWGVPELSKGLGFVADRAYDMVNPIGLASDVIGLFGDNSEESAGQAREAAQANNILFDKMVAGKSAMINAANAAEYLAEETGGLDGWINDVNQSMKEQIIRLENKERRDEAAAEAAEEHAEAIADQVAAIDDLLGRMFDYEESTLGLAASVQELADLTGDDLTLAQIDVAREALAASEAFAAEQGALEGSTQFAALQRDELLRLKQEYPELASLIQEYIDVLNNIPGVITTTLNIAGSGARLISDSYGRKRVSGPDVGNNATGTDFWRGGLTMVGERGPELVNLPRGSQVHTATETARMVWRPQPGTGGHGGGPKYSITVNAGMGTNGTDVGRQVVEHIKRFERANGTGWRT